MIEAPFPPDESTRLSGLRSLGMLDTEAEARFDRITQLAALTFDVPIALVSLVDANRQWFKSCVGLGVRETPRSISFCGHAIMRSDAFVINDALLDPRFADNPLVTGPPFVRFYAGQPLDDGAGHKVGTLCIIDDKPRTLEPRQLEVLRELGSWVQDELRSIGLDRALGARRDSERRLAAVADSLLDGLVMTDRHGVVQSFNPAAERMFGYTREEVLGRTINSLIRNAGSDGARRNDTNPFDDVAHSSSPGRDLIGQRKDGTRFPLELSLSEAASGDDVVLIGVAKDISDRRRAEDALRQSEEIHRSVINAMKEGICIHDASGVVMSCNPAAADILRLRPGQLIGCTPLDWQGRCVHVDGSPFSGLDHPAMVAAASGVPCPDVIIGVETSDRRQRWITVSAQPLLREGSTEPWAVVSTFADVTDRVEIDRMKSEFVSVVSHELRTPLTSIRGSLGLLAGGGLGSLPPRAARMLDIAVANTDRLTRLINDILDIERIESGRTTLVRQHSDAADLVTTTVEALHAVAERARVALVVDAAAAPLYADPDRVIQTLTNLISNAIKFSPSGSEVRISCAATDAAVRFTVVDHGRGIPRDKTETIFERFEQVDASDSREKGGTGLGLAICRSIVTQHGGRIWVDETPGGGSTFVFELPNAVDATGGASSPKSSDRATDTAVGSTSPIGSAGGGAHPFEAAGGRGSRYVLVVEDDESLSQVLHEVLRRRGLRTRSVRTIADATVAIQEVTPALVLLDLGLPDGDGADLVSWLVHDTNLPDLPILVYTAQHLSDARRRRLELQHAEIHTKGKTDLDTLAGTIAHLVGQTAGGPQAVSA